jgi:hypothetical protein
MKFFAFAFGSICLMVGIGFMVATTPLTSMCRTSCWLNEFLFALVGDKGGKIALGLIWVAGGVWFLWQGIRIKRKKKTDPLDK